MKQIRLGFLSTLFVVTGLMSACGAVPNTESGLHQPQMVQITKSDFTSKQDIEKNQTETEPVADLESNLVEHVDNEEEEMLQIQIGTMTLIASLEDNPSVDAFKELLADGEMIVDVQNYGGFEKVGTLPQSIPKDDVQVTAVPGDVMLYQGNSIVIFYGSNSWAYTKLGTITGYSQEELSRILGGKDATIGLSIIPSNESDGT